MTDRVIVYNTAIPQTTDILNTSKFAMIGDASLAMAMLGDSASNPTTTVAGLACTPTSPATLQVNLGPGVIFALDATDASGYGDLGTDATQIYKMGIRPLTGLLTITPPGTVGYSQVYLVQAILSDIDGGSSVLSYYNSSNPAIPYSGPANAGTSQFTKRTNVCTIALKAGVAATTGAQTIPTPDAGYVALYAITVANGQTQINAGNIAAVNGGYAPFVNTALPYIPSAVQSGKWIYAVDTGSTNALVVTPTPVVTSYTPGFMLWVNVINSNTTTTPTINVSGLGTKNIIRRDGSALQIKDLLAGNIHGLIYDGASFRLTTTGASEVPRNLANPLLWVRSDGNDLNDGSANTAGSAFLTIQGALNAAATQLNLTGRTLTIKLGLAGTYVGGIINSIPNVLITSLGPYTSYIVTNTGLTAPAGALNVYGSALTLDTLTINNSNATTHTLQASNGGSITLTGSIGLGGTSSTSGADIRCFSSGSCVISGAIHFNRNSYSALYAQGGGASISALVGSSLAFVGNSFNFACAAALDCGVLNMAGTAPTGTATGFRYAITTNGVINTFSGGASYFPGTTAGTNATGGQYV